MVIRASVFSGLILYRSQFHVIRSVFNGNFKVAVSSLVGRASIEHGRQDCSLAKTLLEICTLYR